MNPVRLKSIYQGLTGLAKKVYDAVPIAESWTTHEIMQEMRRLGSSSAHLREIEGCLNGLIASELVDQTSHGYIRVPVRPKLEVVPKMPAPSPKLTNPIDTLAALSTRLRDLANDIDAAALEVGERLEISAKELTQLHQLRLLLKDLK